MSTPRSMSIPRPVQISVTRKVTSTAANSGVKRRARTGAMFSMTLCLASTSHAPTMTAPIATHGSSHVLRKSSMSSPMERKVSAVSALKTPPPSAFCFSFAPGYIILFGTTFLVGILSFRTLNLWGIQHTYHGLMMMFSGMWIPLWFYPDWLRAVTDILPFRAVFFTPLAIYVGHTTGSALWLSIGQQIVWAIVLTGLCHITWVRTDRHLVVQGG